MRESDAMTPADDGTGFDCVLAFDTDDPLFARGFEAGRLWSDLRCSEGDFNALVHATNTEMALRMGEALQRQVVGEVVDETWTLVKFAAATG